MAQIGFRIGIATATATGQGSRGEPPPLDGKRAADQTQSSGAAIRRKSTVTAATRMTNQPPEKKTAKAGGSLSAWTTSLLRFLRLEPAIRRRVIIILGRLILALMPLLPPILLLVRYKEEDMAFSLVWVLSVTMSLFALLFLLRLFRPWGFSTDFLRLSYGLVLAYVADHVFRWAAIIVLHCNAVCAAGYVGYCLARHRLHVKGTVPAMDLLPNPSPFTTAESQQRIRSVHQLAISMSVFWIVVMTVCVNAVEVESDLDIVVIVSFMGLILASAFGVIASASLTHGVTLDEPTPSFPYLIPCYWFSPFLGFLSHLPLVLSQWLLVLHLVAYFGYCTAVYLHYLHTTEPRLKTCSDDSHMGMDVASLNAIVEVADLSAKNRVSEKEEETVDIVTCSTLDEEVWRALMLQPTVADMQTLADMRSAEDLTTRHEVQQQDIPRQGMDVFDMPIEDSTRQGVIMQGNAMPIVEPPTRQDVNLQDNEPIVENQDVNLQDSPGQGLLEPTQKKPSREACNLMKRTLGDHLSCSEVTSKKQGIVGKVLSSFRHGRMCRDVPGS